MKYFVTLSTLENGNHTIHREDCPHLPDEKDLKYLGEFFFALSAIAEAERFFPQINGCVHCTRAHFVKE